MRAVTYLPLFLVILILVQCDRTQEDTIDSPLLLPVGFEATVVVDSLPAGARHLAVNQNGDIYVKLKSSDARGGVVALRDTNNDGAADIIEQFGNNDGNYAETGIKIRDGHLYFSSSLGVYRYRLTPGELVPTGKMDTIVIDDHEHGDHEHNTKPISFDDRGNMFIPFGAPTNACQEPKRTPGVPGMDPCPNLEEHGGIWRFDADTKNQLQADGTLWSTGIRSVVAMDWNPRDKNLYTIMHGRDDLQRLFPQKFTLWESAMLPSEEFMQLTEGSNFGWPYCYYDQLQQKKVLAPEYGGDGKKVGRCSEFDDPIMGFPGHFAPNALLFYNGNQFPSHYQNGAFIAFHGSTIRNPYPQAGYFIAFVPFKDGEPSGEWEVFANGFAAVDPIVNVSDAKYRPSGLALGPNGSLYIAEDREGKIWRITYKGNKDDFGSRQLARMEEEKRQASNIRRPDAEEDNLLRGQFTGGEKIYHTYCVTCHQRDGQGAPGRFPPIADTEWVTGDKERLIKIILNGLEGNIKVKGEVYDSVMPQHSFLSDEEVAEVLTFIRTNFNNSASAVSTEEVSEVRKKLTIKNNTN
ncbi:PQQ-dependent sugar dehydrogenase [Fodinibius salsisoli]|uniref:PQQ-dependent sugar dehydrogenase n=1 Tax=Fodinibius salsisoli TaxID=2820877 RepID=A0ABT3PPZ7_9BACT|nr:c-type cytochrome [Fodinibius salsisoli]MCW9707926.1 PQQ-dependent sugar dehydrogenase [Fodinibius salsisoli]